MRILLTDSGPTSEAAAETLRGAGHEVDDCCLRGGDGACQGLERHHCGLDDQPDVALATRSPDDAPAAGVVCAKKAGLPVVHVGRHDTDHDQFLAAVERAARRAPDDAVLAASREAARLATQWGWSEAPNVEAVRQGGALVFHVDVPAEVSNEQVHQLSVRLGASLVSTGLRPARTDVVVHRR